jgi:hypothetical protein
LKRKKVTLSAIKKYFFNDFEFFLIDEGLAKFLEDFILELGKNRHNPIHKNIFRKFFVRNIDSLRVLDDFLIDVSLNSKLFTSIIKLEVDSRSRRFVNRGQWSESRVKAFRA